MNSKERVLTSLGWQKPDRVPIQTYLTPQIRAGLEAPLIWLRHPWPSPDDFAFLARHLKRG